MNNKIEIIMKTVVFKKDVYEDVANYSDERELNLSEAIDRLLRYAFARHELDDVKQ